MTLIICESLREIDEVACVTSAWSSCGQTLKFKSSVIERDLHALPFFVALFAVCQLLRSKGMYVPYQHRSEI